MEGKQKREKELESVQQSEPPEVFVRNRDCLTNTKALHAGQGRYIGRD